jgi:phytoene synthase
MSENDLVQRADRKSTPAVLASYAHCRTLNAAHGKTYYLATLLLPASRRPAVHALYGFARAADDIVDTGLDLTPEQRAERLETWFATALRPPAETGSEKSTAESEDPMPALHDTIARYDIPLHLFDSFLDSMRLDLTVTGYPTYADLEQYMYGSAAVIGLQMLPVLGHPGVPYHVVAPYARDLGVAFQLTNFIRDVGEDLRRGRVYLPQESLDLFDVTRQHLARGVVDAPIRRLLAHEIARTRELYATAEPGIRLLAPESQDCIRTAFTLYRGILDEIERCGYGVLTARVTVPRYRRAAVALPGLLRAVRTRHRPS